MNTESCSSSILYYTIMLFLGGIIHYTYHVLIIDDFIICLCNNIRDILCQLSGTPHL